MEIFTKWLSLAGGGERAVATLAEALMRAGHQVVLNTPTPADLSILKEVFGKDVSAARLVVMPPIMKELTTVTGIRRYIELANEFAVRRSVGGDVFVDFSPSSCLGATYPRVPDIAYWTPPIDFRNYTSQLLSDIPHRIAFTPYVNLLLKLLDRMNEIPLNFVCSHYSEKMIRTHYAGHFHAPMRVLYPPLNLDEWKPSGALRARTGVISLARFSPWKRHEMQLEIVGRDTPLTMVGGARDPEEKRTVEVLEHSKTINVKILVNQSLGSLKQLLWNSKVFLHTADNEPSSASILEAIAAGNVPVVRRSGGSVELVPFPELTFTNVEEAKEVVEKALAGDYDRYLPRLSAHISQFDQSVWCNEFLTAIEHARH